MSDETSAHPMARKPARRTVQRVLLRRWLFLVAVLCLSLIGRAAPAQLRVVTYNTMGGPNLGLETVLAAIGPIDVLALQEQQRSAATTAAIAEMLNGIYGAEVYMQGTLEGGTTSESTGRPGLVYNTTTVQLIRVRYFSRDFLRTH